MTDLDTTTRRTNGGTTRLPNEAAAMAADVGQRAMGAAQSTARGLDDALRRLDDESEGTLTIGAAFSLGMAAGLLLGGGPRLLVAAAGTPGIAMALALLRRTDAIGPVTSARPASKA
jgi:hypothetical protein